MYGLIRLLAIWAESDPLLYPLELVHGDKPDFLLRFGNREIGIEHSDAESEEYLKICDLREREDELSRQLFSNEFEMISKSRTAKQLRESLRKEPDGGDGYGKHGWERKWAKCMTLMIRKKTEDFRKKGFIKHETNLLLICDRLPGLFPRIEIAMDYLQDDLKSCQDHSKSYWQEEERYDGILIETGDKRYGRDLLIEIYAWAWSKKEINNLRR